MWELRSREIRTDLFLVGFDGIVEDKGRYVVARTPANPTSWRGNFLLYPGPPDERAATRGHEGSWLDDHEREFPNARSRLLSWDGTDGSVGAAASFADDGFEIDEGTILTATAETLRRPLHWNSGVEVVRVATDADWAGAARALIESFLPGRSGTVEDIHVFVDCQLARYRAMQEAGVGQWFVAVVDGEPAGALGVVRVGELGRFQLVGTDPRFARRGVCRSLVHEASRVALSDLGVTTLVIAALRGGDAARSYESVGFTETERTVALLRKPARA